MGTKFFDTYSNKTIMCWEDRHCSDLLRKTCPAYINKQPCFEACVDVECPCGRNQYTCDENEYTQIIDLSEFSEVKKACLSCEYFVKTAIGLMDVKKRQ